MEEITTRAVLQNQHQVSGGQERLLEPDDVRVLQDHVVKDLMLHILFDLPPPLDELERHLLPGLLV